MANDNNDENNAYSNNHFPDEFIHNSNEEMSKPGDINDIEQYIQNIPVPDQPEKHSNHVMRPSMSIFGNMNPTPMQMNASAPNNMNALYSQILSNYNENGFNVANNNHYDAYAMPGNNILGEFGTHMDKDQHENRDPRKGDQYNPLTGIPQLDAHVLANMTWFQAPPSHLYKNMEVPQKEVSDALMGNMDLVMPEQAIEIQQHQRIMETKKPVKKSKTKKTTLNDLSLLTKQSINEISPLLSDMNNYHTYLQTSQFKNDTKTQRRVQKRKSLMKQGPKRPSSAYFFYCQQERKNLQEKYPSMKVPEMQKKLGEQWRSLSDTEKEPFQEAHKLAWEEYKVKKDEYVATLPPKKPSGPFVDFINSQKDLMIQKNNGKKLQMQELTKLCVEKWKNLDEDTKMMYNARHKEKIDEWIKAYNDIDVKEMKDLMKIKQDMLEAKNEAIEKNRMYQEDQQRQKGSTNNMSDLNHIQNMSP